MPVRERILCGIERRPVWGPSVTLVLASALLLLVGAARAAASPAPPWSGSKLAPPAGPSPGLEALFRKFPFGAARIETTPRATTSTPRKAPPKRLITSKPKAPPAERSDGTGLLWIAVPTGLSSALLLLILIARPLRRKRAARHSTARRPTTDVAGLLGVRPVARASPAWDKSNPVSNERSVTVSDRPEDRNAAKGEESNRPPAAAVSDQDYGGVGTHVQGVLRAADAAAAQIRAEAQEEAAEIRRRAEAEAVTSQNQLKEEVERRRGQAEAEAADVRHVAESYATQHRQEAEEQARQMLTEAEGQARATRQAAEEMAKQIETTAQERRDTLEAAARKLEGRLQRLLEGVRDMSSQIEGLVGPAEREGAAAGSLVEVLRVGNRRDEPEAS